MTSIFINRSELLPPGETQDLHKQWQKEESDIVLQDKNNDDVRTGGLFKGCFRVRAEPGLRAIRDEEDGVDRCPMCAWELEDGECAQCGLQFDDNGTLTWGNSFGGFSDMDEASEHDMSSEDLDGDLELEENETDFDGYGDGEEWQDQYDDDHSYAIRQWLANEALARPQQPFGLGPRRRPAAHSAAGSTRRSYTASLVSDMITEDTEMGNIAEEDENEEDGDSSMNDFIDDGLPENASQGTSSTEDQTPTPPTNLRTRRTRRIIDSESSSSASHQPDEDEDNDDEGPIAPGRRRQQHQYRNQLQPSFRRRPVAPSSSVPEDASIDQDLDEDDTQALLYDQGWSPLGHDGPDDEEMDEDDDSDGGRTTVGWEPTANSVERSRFGGSLTPTADRPNVAIRPPSRVGSSRFIDGSRGLRRRSSVLSAVSSTNYEDGEADDDDSDIDRDGDSSMRSPAVRPRGSRVRLRNSVASNNPPPPSMGFSPVNSGENDTDENSDDTAAPGARRRPRLRAQRQEYDPRISWAFAQHMADLRDLNLQRPEDVLDHLDHLEQLRATTPVARPRTSNRNRAAPSPLVPQFSPISNGSLPPFSPPSNVPARLRTPINLSSVSGSSAPMSPRSDRNQGSMSQVSNSGTDMSSSGSRRTPSSSGASSVTISNAQNLPQTAQGPGAQDWAGDELDDVDRPVSRTNNRTPSANSRRNIGAHNAAYQGPISPGLNFAARFQAQQNRNPWNPFVPLSPMRPRQSVQRLREQSSTATLRPRNSQRGLRQQPSQTNVRDGTAPAQLVRQQNSRVNLRSQPSQHRLSTQPSQHRLSTQPSQHRLSNQVSSRALRASNPPVMHQSNASTSSIGSNGSQRTRLTEEERLSRARELVISRQQALQGGGTNPFAAGRSRQAVPNQGSNAPSAESVRSQYSVSSAQSLGSNSGHSLPSPLLAPPVPNPQPTLGRRRSNRNVGAPPGAVIPPQPTNPNAFIRARSGSIPGVSPYGYERSVSVSSNGITAGGSNTHY